MIDKITISKCCRADFDVHGEEEKPHCLRCFKNCEIEEVCEFCLGDGEVDTDETDSDGNVARGVGSAKCICQIHDEDGDYDEQ